MQGGKVAKLGTKCTAQLEKHRVETCNALGQLSVGLVVAAGLLARLACKLPPPSYQTNALLLKKPDDDALWLPSAASQLATADQHHANFD
jgi:hypothetical protein